MRHYVSQWSIGTIDLPTIRPEEGRVTSIEINCNHSPITIRQYEDILPPKGTAHNNGMWHIIIMAGIPDKVNPRYILLVIELMKMLYEQTFILQMEIDDDKPSFIFRFTNKVPSCQRLFWSIRVSSP